EAVAEIVVRSQQIRRQGPHVQAIEEIATDEVERQAAGLLCDRRDTLRERDQSIGDDMTEVLRDEEQQFRRAGLRLDVDGDAVVDVGGFDAYLKMGRRRFIFTPGVNDPTHEYAVLSERHGTPDGRCGARRPLPARRRCLPWYRCGVSAV